jgi:hypothetical protein
MCKINEEVEEWKDNAKLASSLQENGKNPLSQPIVPLSPKKRGAYMIIFKTKKHIQLLLQKFPVNNSPHIVIYKSLPTLRHFSYSNHNPKFRQPP